MNDDILQHHFDEVFNALQDRENFEIFTKMRPTKIPKVKKTFFKIVSPSEIDSAVSFDEVGILGKTPRRNISQNTFKSSPYNSRPSSASTTTAKAKAVFKPPFTLPVPPRPKSPRPRTPVLSERLQPKIASPRPYSSGFITRPHSPRAASCGPQPARSLTLRTQSVGPLGSRLQPPRPLSSRPQTPKFVSSRPNSPKSMTSRPMSPKSTISNMAYYSLKSDATDILGECKYCGRYILGDFLHKHEENCEQDHFGD